MKGDITEVLEQKQKLLVPAGSQGSLPRARSSQTMRQAVKEKELFGEVQDRWGEGWEGKAWSRAPSGRFSTQGMWEHSWKHPSGEKLEDSCQVS